MKYLKTYEELSPEYLARKAGDRDTPQKQRIGAAADKLINQRNQEEADRKRKAEEEERLKDPIYKQNKELAQKRYSLAKNFSNEVLNFYFTPNSFEIEDEDNQLPYFINKAHFVVGEYAEELYDLWHRNNYSYNYDEVPFRGAILLGGDDSGSGGTFERRDNTLFIEINKDGLIIEENDFNEGTYYDGEEERGRIFSGVRLVGMDLASKNKLANFIKQYIPEATCGNGNLKVSTYNVDRPSEKKAPVKQMPVSGKDFGAENYKTFIN